MNKYIAVFFGTLLGATALSNSCAADKSIDVGQRAPACELASLGSSAASKTDYKGKVVYVDFWASWCPPCLKSLPFLNTLNRDLKDRGLQVIGVNVDEHISDANAFLKNHPASFIVGSDSKGDCPKAFGIMGMPSSYLIDRKGNIRHVHIGFRDGDRKELRQAIEQLLAEDAPAPAVMTATSEISPKLLDATSEAVTVAAPKAESASNPEKQIQK